MPAMRGITVPDVSVRVIDNANRTLLERREAVLFAHFGLTGPAILDVSRAVARHEGQPLRLRLDFAPDVHEEELNLSITARARQGRPWVVQLVPKRSHDALPRRASARLRCRPSGSARN